MLISKKNLIANKNKSTNFGFLLWGITMIESKLNKSKSLKSKDQRKFFNLIIICCLLTKLNKLEINKIRIIHCKSKGKWKLRLNHIFGKLIFIACVWNAGPSTALFFYCTALGQDLLGWDVCLAFNSLFMINTC
jgi:hypothetical protein